MTVMNFGLYSIRRFLYQLKTIKFSKKTLYHGVGYSFGWNRGTATKHQYTSLQYQGQAISAQVVTFTGQFSGERQLVKGKKSFSSLREVLISSSAPDLPSALAEETLCSHCNADLSLHQRLH
jgi:hypothetical protein